MTNVCVFIRQNHAFLTLFAAFALSGAMLSSSTYAQERNKPEFADILPVITTAEDPGAALPSDTTHQAIRLTPDKSEILRLDTNAKSVIIGNPAHLSILADTSRTLILVPKAPGATHFSILDNESNIIMQRHAIIAAPTTDYIRIRKTCASGEDGCTKTSVYYCPDMCHEIQAAEMNTQNNSAGTTTQQNANISQKSNAAPANVQEGEPVE
ncbi:MAG: pilus assembly protein N-terminal domain-containing protein [Alphaproteobacteria bacterium]